MINFTVLTIFPEMFNMLWDYGVIRRGIALKKISASAVNIRDFAEGKHRVTDDKPYGGGCGMVMKPEPLASAISAAKNRNPSSKTILMTPQGRVFNQALARELAEFKGLILVCGRYEGIDERIYNNFIDYEISTGDYVMTGGELPAMTIIDTVSRLVPGILGSEDSAKNDSFSDGLLEYAQYTRPRNFEGSEVPEILLSGNHRKIEQWRTETSLIRTFLKRKDLLGKKVLSKNEVEILKKWCRDIEKIIHSQSLLSAGTLSGSK